MATLRSSFHYVKKDHSSSLGFATIFAPPDFMLLGPNPSTLLHKAVRLHILPQRFRYKELASLPIRTLLKTFVPDELLEIDEVLDIFKILDLVEKPCTITFGDPRYSHITIFISL